MKIHVDPLPAPVGPVPLGRSIGGPVFAEGRVECLHQPSVAVHVDGPLESSSVAESVTGGRSVHSRREGLGPSPPGPLSLTVRVSVGSGKKV